MVEVLTVALLVVVSVALLAIALIAAYAAKSVDKLAVEAITAWEIVENITKEKNELKQEYFDLLDKHEALERMFTATNRIDLVTLSPAGLQLQERV